MRLFSDIEKTIERGFRKWTEHVFGAAQSDELLLVHRAILEEIETKVQTAGRGQRVFPYSLVTVTLMSADADRRALYAAAFGAEARLANDVRQALEGAGCQLPSAFAVDVKTAESGRGAFEIRYGTAAPAPPAPASLVVVKGKAESETYPLSKPRTNIGRLAELTDAEARVVRRNDVVFLEGADESNNTVSRKHAHIQFAANTASRMTGANSAPASSAMAARSTSPPATAAAKSCAPATRSTWAAPASAFSNR